MKHSNSIVAFFLFLLLTGCAYNPVTGKKELSFMSEAQEIAMGKESDPYIVAQYGLYDNQGLQDFIADRGQKMASVSHRSNLDYTFRILDSDVVNAFAVPGGYVYFTRGIMAYFNNEAQFAGVLGHEIGHIAARHSAEQYTKQMIAQIAFMGGMIASEKFRDFAGEAMQGMQLLFLKFSRGNESEADVLGVYYSSQVGYDAHEMADFFKTLEDLSTSEDGSRLPEFLSTHPDPGRRYEEVNRLADEWQSEYGASDMEIDRDSYLRMIDGIVYGEDPRQGYLLDNVFYQPEMKFLFPVPSGWQYMNSPSQVQMAPQDGNALMLITLSGQKTLRSATDEIKQQLQLKNSQEASVQVGGFPALKMVSDYPQETDPFTGKQTFLALQTVLIEYDGNIYVFHGLSSVEDRSKYASYFNNTMTGFRKLTDPARINVKPERIKVETVSSNTTLKQYLQNRNIPASRLHELATLNGMDENASLKAGQLIKMVAKE